MSELPSFDDFTELYQANHRRMVATILLAVGDLDTAAEATDEAFARALARWPRVQQMDQPLGWIYRVALNVARRRRRRQAVEERLLARSRTEPVVDEHAWETWQLLAGLPPRQRTAAVLRVVADLPEAAIAEAMGVSRSTVASTLANARSNLQEVHIDDSTQGSDDPSATSARSRSAARDGASPANQGCSAATTS